MEQDTLAGVSGIKLCILYGSAACGKLIKESDIDIAIAGDAVFNREYLVDLQLALSRRPGYEADIVDMKNIEGLILSEILRKGKVLIKRDTSLYAEFIKKVIYFNEDVLPNVRMILKKRAERYSQMDIHINTDSIYAFLILFCNIL